uniref:Uncharacterized protein n=1 Tax=Osmundaria fimbriata TaxID=228265 RepID=A0A1Z1M3V7_OSMFI|nr:hypothetical protein [Osmundaria fimbriata]ARW60768.1 hypothetical protein [Osmundaria fimbriata]
MNFYIYTLHNFHCICILPVNKIKNMGDQLNIIIPEQLRILFVNEGSLTYTMQHLTGKIIGIEILQQKYERNEYKKPKLYMRFAWIETEIYTKLIFARSLWNILYNHAIYSKIKENYPIGNSFIKYKSDIYKHIHEVYYGYCYKLEKYLECKSKIWGRKYTLYYGNKSYATIQEIFSPHMISFLTNYNILLNQ